ncbi:MAG: hypothetical protein JST12_11150 [Armatimonadetes bacterium]|nr:hypothetical protein [Armatimonadota bacterium]
MLWDFGIVFLVFVAFFSFWLHRNSARNRDFFTQIDRRKRIVMGLLASLTSFGSALCALRVADGVRNWQAPDVLHLVGILLFMMIFVGLQVLAMLSFVSLATTSETDENTKRS